MKKTYIKPTVDIVTLNISNHLLQASGTDLRGSAPTNATGLGREGDFDDDF